MLVAISLGVLVGLASLVAMAVILLAAGTSLVRFLGHVEDEPHEAATVLAVTREISAAALASPQPQG